MQIRIGTRRNSWWCFLILLLVYFLRFLLAPLLANQMDRQKDWQLERQRTDSWSLPPPNATLEFATVWKWIRISLESQMIVLMDLVLRQNHMSPCLKFMRMCLNFFGTKHTHSHVPGLKEEALFWTYKFFFCLDPITLVNLCKYYELPSFYSRSLLNFHSVLLALISPMWHCVTLTLFPKFCYLDEKMYLGRWLLSLPSLPLAVTPCHNSS